MSFKKTVVNLIKFFKTAAEPKYVECLFDSSKIDNKREEIIKL